MIAPLLRQAKLSHRPAALLRWEAIVNDPIGALAAVLAYEVIVVSVAASTVGEAAVQLIIGLIASSAVGAAGGYGIAQAFRRGWVPEYMKVPVLFVVLLGVFAGSNALLHESGLLAVTIMGVRIANANLPSYEELRRFKEHATVLLVSGVFVLLAASIDLGSIMALDLRALAFITAIILLARPITVYLSLLGTKIPRTERTLVAFTGPRGVVLVAVAGLFGLGHCRWRDDGTAGLWIGGGDCCVAWIYINPCGAGLGVVMRGCAWCFDRWGHQFGHATRGTFA